MRAALAALVFVPVVVGGCPAPRSEAPKASDKCGEGSVIALGACVPYRVAESLCGKNAKPLERGGCKRTACGLGEALDVDHGFCLPESSVRTLLHAPQKDEDAREDEPKRHATCQYGVLAGRNNQLRCAVGKLSCGRGERWVKPVVDAGVSLELGGKCESEPACNAGEIFDAVTARCARVVRNGQVDMGAWARLAIGTDTAEGTNMFCAPVRATGGGGRFQIEITVPENDVTRASARLIGLPGAVVGASDVAGHSLDALVETLHFYGGSALAASVSLEVVCTAPPTMPPSLEASKEGDAGFR
jgi:hypothetical protein